MITQMVFSYLTIFFADNVVGVEGMARGHPEDGEGMARGRALEGMVPPLHLFSDFTERISSM